MTTRSMQRLHRFARGFFWLGILVLLWPLLDGAPAAEEERPGDTELPDARPVPGMQVVPLPYDQASFRLEQKELTRYHFGPSLLRPFLYPVLGPEGCSLTRMGQPSDPHGHRHHNSVWISHSDVQGVNFWGDDADADARIVTLRVEQYLDGGEAGPGASILVTNAWRDAEDRTVMLEHRRVTVGPVDEATAGGPWTILIDLELSAPDQQPVTLGQTPFGIIGVRMTKSIGVREGGGRILNSEGQRNEDEMFRKPARWVDYSGQVTNAALGGIVLMDHPGNPNHPAPFHVRDEGWMGACLTFTGPLTIEPAQPLRLRYGLWVHAGIPDRETVENAWSAFSSLPLAPLSKDGN